MATSTAPAATITDSVPVPPELATARLSLAAVAQPGIAAIKRLWLPFALIQLCGLAVVVCYFQIEPFRQFCERLAVWKRAGGVPAAALMMSVASGFVPDVFKFIVGNDRSLNRQRWRNLVFNMALFAISGSMVDCFYHWLANTFGDSRSPGTVIAKMALDQLVYSPLVGMLFIALAYTFREHRYRPIATLRSLGAGWYLSRVATLLVPCWAYWTPMTALMYSLPSSLTFVFGAPASAAAAIILIAVAERKVVRPHPTAMNV